MPTYKVTIDDKSYKITTDQAYDDPKALESRVKFELGKQGVNVPAAAPSGFMERNPDVATGLRWGWENVGKPVMEGAGMVAGATGGAATGTIVAPGAGTAVGGVAGAGIGYSLAKRVEAMVEQAAGYSQPKSLKDEFLKIPGEVATGAAFQAGGEGAAAAVGKAATGIKTAANTLFTKATGKDLGETLYKSMAKFGTGLAPETREKMVRTALREKLPLDQSGWDKLTSTIDGLNSEIDSEIASAKAKFPKGKNPFKIGNVADEAYKAVPKQVGKYQESERIDAARKVIKDFWQEWKGRLDLETAQKLKKSLNQELADHFAAMDKTGKGRYTDAETDALNAIRAGLKKEIERLAPAVKELNKREGDLIQLQPNFSRAINRIDNHNPFKVLSIGSPSRMFLTPERISKIAIGFDAQKTAQIVNSNISMDEKVRYLKALGMKGSMIGSLLDVGAGEVKTAYEGASR